MNRFIFIVNNSFGDVMLSIHNRYDRNGNKIEEISVYEPKCIEELCEFLDEIYSSVCCSSIEHTEI